MNKATLILFLKKKEKRKKFENAVQRLGTGLLWPGQCWQGGKGDSRDTSTFVTSCPIGMSLPADSSCEGRVSLHFTQSRLSIPAAAGVVVERGSEYKLDHTGPRELDGHPLGGCGSGFGLVPGYTTLSVRVRANIQFGALKIKSVRTNEQAQPQPSQSHSFPPTSPDEHHPTPETFLQSSLFPFS